jgi:uncharacterized membrane protein YedE/YeeE
VLQSQLPWFIGGPIMGLCVVAARALFNGRLGVTGGFSEIISKVSSGSVNFDWRGWFAIGIVVAGVLFALLSGEQSFQGYGWLTRTFSESSIWIPAILLVSGLLIGFGAKTAGGCTSGNGLSGTSSLSASGLLSTCVFFGTAIVVANLIQVVI